MASAESLWRKKSLSFPFWTLIIAACESSPVSSPTCVYAKSLQSCPTLCNPVDCSSPGSSVQRFSRQEYWSGLPCPPAGVSSWPRDGTYISRLLHWQVGSLPLVPPWKPKRAGFLTLFNWSSVLFFFFNNTKPSFLYGSNHRTNGYCLLRRHMTLQFAPEESGRLISFIICLVSIGSEFTTSGIKTWLSQFI